MSTQQNDIGNYQGTPQQTSGSFSQEAGPEQELAPPQLFPSPPKRPPRRVSLWFVGISCANIMDNPSLQSLVLVRHHNASNTLDAYVFNNITSARPQRIFLQEGLVKGDALFNAPGECARALKRSKEPPKLRRGRLLN